MYVGNEVQMGVVPKCEIGVPGNDFCDPRKNNACDAHCKTHYRSLINYVMCM